MAGSVGARHQAGPGGGAVRTAGIGRSELHALLGETIKVRRLEKFASHEPHVLPAKVVSQNEDEVGLLGHPGERRKKKAKEKQVCFVHIFQN